MRKVKDTEVNIKKPRKMSMLSSFEGDLSLASRYVGAMISRVFLKNIIVKFYNFHFFLKIFA